jgi:hypothetical protein
MRCANHPQTETYVQCLKCDRPICGECMVTGTMGLVCPSCASPRSASKVPKLPRLPKLAPKAATDLIGSTGLVRGVRNGAVGAVVAGSAINALWWIGRLFGGWLIGEMLSLLAAMGVGFLIGELVLRGAGGKQGRFTEWIAVGCALLAAILWKTPWLGLITKGFFALLPFGWLFLLAAIVLCVAGAVIRTRYL